jgi:hypothetical protein
MKCVLCSCFVGEDTPHHKCSDSVGNVTVAYVLEQRRLVTVQDPSNTFLCTTCFSQVGNIERLHAAANLNGRKVQNRRSMCNVSAKLDRSACTVCLQDTTSDETRRQLSDAFPNKVTVADLLLLLEFKFSRGALTETFICTTCYNLVVVYYKEITLAREALAKLRVTVDTTHPFINLEHHGSLPTDTSRQTGIAKKKVRLVASKQRIARFYQRTCMSLLR